MKPYPIPGQGSIIAFLLFLFSSTIISAQLPEDLEKMGKEAKGFQFHLKFRYPDSPTPAEAKYARITALLDKYKLQVPAGVQLPFKVQGPEAGQRPFLTDNQKAALKNQAVQFFNEMSNLKLSVWDLQEYKDNFKNKNPRTGDNPVDPKIAWKGEYEGIERTLMGGRTLMVMDVWKQTLVEYFNKNPEAVGVVYGQMDIGSWVKMNVEGLGFAADVDFSTIATDHATNQSLNKLFAKNLEKSSGLGMVPINVLHTTHGLAGAEVYIGEWGKTFAEVDMLRRDGKWKLLQVVRNENGEVIDIKTVEKEGKELFIEKGIDQERKAQQKDPAMNFDPKERYPELTINMEPMLSLEMLRHAISDVELGPFQGGQKIIKMIKYTERSFFMMDEAGKNIPVKDGLLYFQLTPEEESLKTLCEEVIKNKGDPTKIVTLLEAYSGKKLEHNEQVNLIVDDLVDKCKKAMLKNANQAFGYRFRTITQIEDETIRSEEAEKFLNQVDEEIKKGFEESGTKVPETMRRARTLLHQLRSGKIQPGEVDAKLKELNDLMAKEYHIEKSFIERWIGDPWNNVKKFFIERGYGPNALKMANDIKERLVTDWKNYAPDNLQSAATTMYEKAAFANNKLNSFNEQLAKTTTGRMLSKQLPDYADNAFALYDAWMSGKDLVHSAKRVTSTIGTIWAQGRWPFLAIPLGIYNSLETKSMAPAAMAAAFYLFPMAGQVSMVTNLIDRLVVSNIMDYNFRNHLDRLAVMAQTDGQGHVLRFKVPKTFSGLTGSTDYLETDPAISTLEPARTRDIKVVFYNEAFLYCPDIKYFISLIPRKSDQFGMYESKLKNLMTLFAFDPEFIGYLLGVEKFKKDKEENGLPVDAYSIERNKMLDDLERGIEDHLWSAVFTAIESVKRAEKKGVVEELEAKIVLLEDYLLLNDSRMKKIDRPGLLLRIRKEIQDDPMYKQALKDKFSAGTAYERVAIPTLERYIKVYEQIEPIQKKIFDIWRPFGVDATKLQEDGMRLLLFGGLAGAPMLTTDPVKDLRIAIACLEAHTKRATDIRIDLAGALGRPIKENDKEDKEHLSILGQLGFGIERLIDADNEGRSPLFNDADGLLDIKREELKRRYEEYLAKLKEGPSITVTLKLEAEKETTETNPVTAQVKILNEKNMPVPLPANTTLEWFLIDDNSRKEIKVTEGDKFTHDAARQGGFTYTIKLTRKLNNKQTLLANTSWHINVKRFDASNSSKGIILKLPSVIKQYDIVDASITVPTAIKNRPLKCNWGYTVIGKNDDCGGAKLQYNSELTTTGKDGKKYLDDSILVNVIVTVMTPGKAYGEDYTISRKVKYQHMSINVKATDIWVGNSGPNWFRIERKPINNPPRNAGWMKDKIARSTASAKATVGLKDDKPMVTIKTLTDLKNYMDKKATELASRKLIVKEVTVGDFKGYGLYSPPKYDPGGFSGGYKDDNAGSSFSGYIMKGTKIFEVYWSVDSRGAFDHVDKAWMMTMVDQLAAEAAGILSSASFEADGRLTKSPYTGPKLDGSDYPQVSIEPKIDIIQPGSKVSVNAVIKNDKPEYGPYTYNWSGHVEGNTQGSSAQLISDRPGKKTINVTVSGTAPPGTASLEYVVAPLKLRVTKISPTTDKIVVGMPVELRADFISAIPAGKKLEYLWQPHPEEKFDPFEGNSNTTKVIFTKPGNKKIWVQLLDKTTAETITLGESDDLELVVEKPAFTIAFNPVKALVGEQVTATINSKPAKLEEVSYRWMPLPSNATLIKESQDGSEIIFYAKDALQIPIEVLALVKNSGEELGHAKSYFSAERYTVKVEGPKVQGPKPMIWKPGFGLVEVDKEIAVHQIVEFSALVTPQPTSAMTYTWTVSEGNASISNPSSRDARVTALETCTIQVNVTVKDNNGVVLGTGVGSFTATISNDMIMTGTKIKKEFDDKVQQTRQLMRDGKLDEAVKLGMELKSLNAKDAAPLINELAEACKKSATDAERERDFTLAVKRYEQALQLNPNDAAAKRQLEVAKANKENDITVIKARSAQLIKEGQEAETNGQIGLAIKKYKESIALVPNATLEAKIKKLETTIIPSPDEDKGVNPPDPKKEIKIFENGNIGGVSSGPTQPTQFSFTKPTVITRIENYHYFNRGKKPGTIGLRNNSTGKVYGPWQAYGLKGQGGVQNAYWDALPNIELPAGTYTVVDSDPSTWSYNSESKGCGFTSVWTTKEKKPDTDPDDPGDIIEVVDTGGGVTAEKIFITGDIDNLGFGFPKSFDVFSGNPTPSHGYPWKIDPKDAKGTDRIMVGTSNKSNRDGYAATTSRPDNQPQAITLNCPVGNLTLQSAVLQLFVDDFQPVAFGSKFSVTINGRRAAFLETVLNSLNQTGPIGKLISVKMPADFLNEIRSGKLVIYVDDATSGLGDGFAIDFVRLVINPSAYSYTGTITGIVFRPDRQPAAGASINAGGIISTTANSKGEFMLTNVPAGMVSINASYNNHHHKTIPVDLAAGRTIKITINLPPD